MENVLTKEQLLEFIRKNKIQSVSNTYESLKDLFKDLLQSFFRNKNWGKFRVRKIWYKNKQKINFLKGVYRQFRKVTKTKSVFPNDTALEKMLYIAANNVVRKWTQRYRNWDVVLNQLLIMYPERLSEYIN